MAERGNAAPDRPDLSSAEYKPLDLSALCSDVPVDLVPDDLPQGATALRGLPFVIGSASDSSPHVRRLAAFGPSFGRAGGTIPIPSGTRHVIVAHATLDSDAETDSLLGQNAVRYIFHLQGGGRESVDIRHRFEISCFGSGAPMGSSGVRMGASDVLSAHVLARPHAAFSAQYDSKFPRTEGPWAMSGVRLQQGKAAYPIGLKLWIWSVAPGQIVESFEVEEAQADFILGGVTVGTLEEYPITLEPSRPVLVRPVAGTELPAIQSIEVNVDRGLATFPMRLGIVDESTDGLAPAAGWGESEEVISGAYCRVTGTPSAKLSIESGQETLGVVDWGELQRVGKIDGPKVTVELPEDRQTWVHTTVVDRDTGQPVPCRVHFRSRDGIPYQPHGHHDHLNLDIQSHNVGIGGDVRLGGTTYAYIDGRCQGWLPVGDVVVEVVRGFEYEAVRETVRIEPGQHQLTIEIGRWSNARSSGWYSGDTHVHFLSASGAHLEAAGEDLDVVNLLQAQWGSLYTNVEDWTGTPVVSDKFGTIVHTGQENRQRHMGHLGLLGISEPIMPFGTDGAACAELGGALETTLSDWADRCHAQGGTVTLAHFGYQTGEMSALIATGRADAAEMIWMGRYFHSQYYRHLNAGYALPLVAGTDKMSAEVPLGIYRTYVRIDDDEPLTYDAWLRNLRLGRTFITAGPLLDLEVEGRPIGGLVTLPSGGGHVEVHANARTSKALPVYSLQLIVNGAVVHEVVHEGGTTTLQLSHRVRIEKDSWVAVRAGGPGYFDAPLTHCAFQRGIFAHTSPVYVTTGNAWLQRDRSALQYMMTLTEGNLDYVRRAAVKHGPDRRSHPAWASDYPTSLERPLLEALEAISARMRDL